MINVNYQIVEEKREVGRENECRNFVLGTEENENDMTDLNPSDNVEKLHL